MLGAGTHGEAELAGLAQRVRSMAVVGPSAAARHRMQARFDAFIRDEPSRGIFAIVGGWLGLDGRYQSPVAKFAAGAVLIMAAGSAGSLAAGTTPWAVARDVADIAGNVLVNLNPSRSFGDGNVAGVDDSGTPTPTPSPGTGTGTPASGAIPPLQNLPPYGATAPADASDADETPTPPPATTQNGAAGATPDGSEPSATATPPSPTPFEASPAGSTTPEPSSPTPAAESTSTPEETPGTTHTPSPAVSPTPEPNPTSTPAPGETIVQALNAGSLTYSFEGGVITLVGVTPSSGWTFEVETSDDDKLVVDFSSGEQKVSVTVEIEDGVAVSTVEEDNDE